MYTKENLELAKRIMKNDTFAQELAHALAAVLEIQQHGASYSYEEVDRQAQLASIFTTWRDSK